MTKTLRTDGLFVFCETMFNKKENGATHHSPCTKHRPRTTATAFWDHKGNQRAKKNLKSPGVDAMPAELIKAGGKAMRKSLICAPAFGNREWPDAWRAPVFIPIPQRGETINCTNNRPITRFCHCSEILLKVIGDRMKPRIYRNCWRRIGFSPR